MIKNKIFKLLVSILIAIMMIGTICQTSIYATEKTENISLALSGVRVIKNGTNFEDKVAYALNTGSNHPIYQIVQLKNGQKAGTNFLCLNATVGNTWNGNRVGTEVTYDTSYDLVSDKSTIANLKDEYKNVAGSNYTQIMWLLDHFLLGTDYTEADVDELLNKAGIVYTDKGGTFNGAALGKAYYFDTSKLRSINPNSAFVKTDSDLYNQLYGNSAGKGGYYCADEEGNKKDIRLSKELVESVEQAAIWFFTNNDNSDFNCYTANDATTLNSWLRYKKDSDWDLLANQKITGRDNGTDVVGETGAMLQEQASILYNYFIDSANKAATEGYTTESKGTIKLEYVGTNAEQKITEEGSNYKVGPLKVTTTGNTTINKIIVTTGTSETAISGVTLKNASGTEISKPTSGENFFVIVPKSSINDKIKIKVTATTKAVEKRLLIVKDGVVEQPIAEVTPSTEDIEAPIEIPLNKQFDLALRKTIVRIEDSNGVRRDILNEAEKDATRNVTVDPTSIPDTAKYKHRKDPIVVDTGYIITYRITIYNEGEIDGYASKIIDQLPTGLVSVLKKNGTVTSNNGNTYKVTEYDTTTNKLELSIDTSKNITSIEAFNGTTPKNDYIEIKCKVTGTAKTDGKTKQYLTNIAYIAEEYDKNGNKIEADRDGKESKPTTFPNKTANELNNSNANNYKGNTENKSVYADTNNEEYYEGQEDDDDFEKVVILPKQFDLALRKFITKINDKNITDREPNIASSEVEKLINNKATYDNGTTASKKHSKDKLKVKIDDTVIYTIRIYNEGDIDGYASEVTDYLPEGLSLKENSTINDTYRWTKGTGNAIITTYLSDKLITSMNSTSESISYRDLQVECIVNDKATATNLKNIAEITVDKDKDGNDVEDRDSTPNSVNKDDYNPTNPEDGRGEQDDDDFEDLELAKFDLALRKFISKVSTSGNFEDTETTTTYNRAPQVVTSELKDGTADTAIYNHSKEPVSLHAGDFVLYTIRAYNEGDLDGYASQITDYLPENLDFVESTDEYINSINEKWEYDSATRKVTTTTNTKLEAFKSTTDNGQGSGLSKVDVQIICKVNNNAVANKKLTNIAEISEYKDEDGNVVAKDRDSDSNNLVYPENPETYKDDEINKEYVPGQQDDDDFEKVIIKEKIVDLALTKFITAVSVDDKINDGEYLTPNHNIGSKTNEYERAPIVDTTGLRNGTSTNASYTPKKNIEPVEVSKNSYVLYNIRVYNEGETDVYAGEVTDYLPENLEFVPGERNNQYGWTAEGQKVKTNYLSSSNGADKILKAFDKKDANSELDYKDLPILCKVSDKAENGKKMVNTAVITKYEDEKGNEIPEDIDSTPDKDGEKNVEERDEDDDDYEVIIIKDFDLALRKFITTIEGKDISSRIPEVKYENGKITYTHPKDVLKTVVGDTVIYTLRVFNEGDIAGYAEEITDDIPEYLEFLPEDATNREYKWVMYDKDGKSTTKVDEAEKIKTDYTSKANGELLMKNNEELKENPNLLNAFNKEADISDTNPDYVDVKVAFKVKDPNSNETIITNKAQISEDADKDGNPVEDIDSKPDEWNDGEDDQDYENISVDYFDLSLLKYVTKAIVTENGKTKTIKTGNNGSKNDVMPIVPIHRKSINKTIVKFEYVIKITNEGDIAGYAKEITDYVPKGLKFYKEDKYNNKWKDEGNNVISTEALKDTLLQPGQSATVKVTLRWINGDGEDSLKTKINIAEISEDYNEKEVPDRDSTPDNKKPGEDDIDDAPVKLTISTGMLEHTIQYVTVALVILVVLGAGLVAIKKYVL